MRRAASRRRKRIPVLVHVETPRRGALPRRRALPVVLVNRATLSAANLRPPGARARNGLPLVLPVALLTTGLPGLFGGKLPITRRNVRGAGWRRVPLRQLLHLVQLLTCQLMPRHVRASSRDVNTCLRLRRGRLGRKL